MKTTALKSIIAILVLALGVLFSSCNKEDEIAQPALSVSVDDELYASEVFTEVDEISDEAMEFYENLTYKSTDGNGYRHRRLSDCVTVTREFNDSVKIITINFGDTNCVCNDGRERRGKIIMMHEGNYWDGNIMITVTFEDFYVDDNQITGTKTIAKSINEDGNRVSIIATEGTIILADGTGTITYAANKVRETVLGSDTKNKWDDVTETTGGSSCILADGTEVVSTIINPLVRKYEEECMMYIVQGIVEIEKTGESLITIDFGDGTCDNLAELTQDGITTTIELQRKRMHRMH